MSNAADPSKANAVGDTCPLPLPTQTQNLWIYAFCFWLQYLASPVTYVGSTQASLTKLLGASDVVSNLSAVLYFAMAFMPVLLAKSIPYVAFLRQSVVVCFASNALAMVAVVVLLLAPVSREVQIIAVIVQSCLAGAAMPAASAFMWEAIARGVAESRRGYTLGVTFGAGPLLGVVGAIASQVVLTGVFWDVKLFTVGFPFNYAILYAAAAPMTGLCAILASRLTIPLPDDERDRSFPWGTLGGVWAFLLNLLLLLALLAGTFYAATKLCEIPAIAAWLASVQLEPVHVWLGFFIVAVLAYTAQLVGQMLRDPLVLLAFAVAVLIYTGNLMYSNMTLYVEFALGAPPSDFLGWQNTLRFGVKAIAGVGLGWLLTRTNPKAGVLACGLFFMAAQIWAMLVPGIWYLAAFGLYGAGELIGVYAPNYMLAASRQRDIRRNMAFSILVSLPSSLAGILFGGITDYYRGIGRPAAGYPVSFGVCAALIGAGLVLALVTLPPRPRPRED